MTPRSHTFEPIDTSTEVETPEHVRFHYHLAGPAKRALAYLIDLLVRAGIVLVLFICLAIGGFAMDEEVQQFSTGILLLSLFVLEWGYYVFCETLWSGRSPGKRALRLRVVTDTGQPLRFVDSLLRNLVRAADWLPSAYALGAIAMGRDARFRRLGDLVAGTMVVTEERHRVTEPLRIEPPPTAKELRSLPMRLPLTAEELDAIELYLRRVPKLSIGRAVELAEMVAPVFARRLGVRYKDPQRFLELLLFRSGGGQGAGED
jgi:uncharacterized RDD family membrane protein YckC